MGLRQWRDPDEKQSHSRDALKNDPTACARSSIRRRPSVHGRRASRPRLPRDLSARFERSPPPRSPGIFASHFRAVPPIATLLESADRHAQHQPSSRITARRAEQEALSARHDRPRELNDVLGLERSRDTSDNQSNSPILQISSSNGESLFEPMPVVTLLPRPSSSSSLIRSPRPLSRSQSQSRRSTGTRRVTLPTPPLDISGPDEPSQHTENADAAADHATDRRSHPLSQSWRPGRPESPVGGLGDRERSPIAADGWDIIRTTITPDDTLPSADSSFTSAAASQSFNAGHDAGVSESSSSTASRLTSNLDGRSDSVSSLDPDDLVCAEDDVLEGETIAMEMFRFEMATTEGRERVDRQRMIHDREGNRFGMPHESSDVDVGFRLIDEALDTLEGRVRLDRVRDVLQTGVGTFDHVINFLEDRRDQRQDSRSGARSLIQRPWSPRPERYGEEAVAAARDASQQVHTFFARSRNSPPRSSWFSRTSLPPRREWASGAGANASSAVAAAPHTLSSDGEASESHGRRTSEPDASEALFAGDMLDLGSMRRIVERLAARDDVPDEWWMSMGLNLARARPRQMRRSDESRPVAGSRVQNGRIASRSSQSLAHWTR